jgi:hypothetical protein
MRKGLTITLMTVAIALVSVQAMALAPVISDLPSPIVGSNTGVTGANPLWTPFVYPDAMDLNTLASDDFTSASSLMWTYTGSNLAYLINGVPPISLTTTDPTSPTTSQIINRTVAAAEAAQNLDGKANTITIRNKNLAPLGGQVTLPTTPGLQTAQLVTFFCSDGNLYSSKTVYFYTDNGGMNRLSGGSPWTTLKGLTGPPSGADKFTGWFWAKDNAQWAVNGGTCTTHTYNTSGGMCLDVGGAQNLIKTVDLISPYAYFTLAKNKLYRLTLQMNGSQLSPGTTPLWDFIIQNAKPGDGTVGYNLYAQDSMFYDNPGFGGQNTVLNTSLGSNYVAYFAPGAVETSQWNDAATGAFATANVAQVQPLCEFRILNYPGLATGAGETRVGSVCIQGLTVESTDISRVKVLSSPVGISSLVQANSSSTGNVQEHSLYATGLSSAVFSGGAVTITPGTTVVTFGTPSTSVTGQQQEAAEIYPAIDLTDGNDPSVASFADNWPITWNTNDLLRYQVDVTTTDASSPWDAIMLNMQGMDSEVLFESYVTSNFNIAAPKANVKSTYEVFFYSMNKPFNNSNSSISGYQRLRWVLRFFNSPTVNFPTSTVSLNKSPITVTGIRVDKVAVQ